MSCYRRTTAVIQAEITEYEEKLTEAKETLSAIAGTPNKKNMFNDSEGAQSVEKRTLSEQTDYIEWLETELKKLRKELCGKGSGVVHYNRRSISGGGIRL